MKVVMKQLLLGTLASALFAVTSHASSPASDNAGNYGGNWNPGDNFGTGFGAWTMNATGGGGRYIGATGQGPSPSFGVYSTAIGTQSVDRPFTGALSVGQTFSVDVGNSTFVIPGGEVGLNLLSGSSPVLTLKFVGNGSSWLLNDGGSDFGISQVFAANTDLLFTFTYNGGSSYSYTFGSATGLNFTANATISSLDGVRFYSANQGNGENFGFNNLAIVPEPSTMVLVGCGLVGAWFLRRRKA